MFFWVLSSILAACSLLPEEVEDTPCDDPDTSSVLDTAGGDPGSLTSDETSALGTWTSGPVAMVTADGTVVEGDRVAILLPEDDIGQLDLTTTLTRVRDHNSSRSNKTASVWIDDGFGDEGGDSGMGSLTVSWDGLEPCTELPCVSNGRPQGAASRLSLDPGEALADGRLAMTWGETTDMKEAFTGYLVLGWDGSHRGHVTVLKAAATDDGEILVTTALESKYLAIYSGVNPVYEGAPMAGTLPLVTLTGTAGVSWPKGLSLETTAVGTMLGLTW